MIIVTLYRIVRFAWQGFWRNFWLSVATVSIIVLASLTVNTLLALNVVADSAVKSLQQKIDISIYFDPGADEATVLEVQDYLAKLSQVASVRYISPAVALQELRLRHSDDAMILQALEDLGENPLGATLIVTAHQPEDYPEIAKILDRSPYKGLVTEENFSTHRATIDEIIAIASRVNRTGLAISLFFVVIAILIAFNTIRVTIYTHREEIAIMKLVGASNAIITAPFVVEGVLYALIASVITAVVTLIGINGIQPQLQNFFTGTPLNLAQYFTENFFTIFGLQLVGITLLNVVASTIAIRRYLKV
ncbi:MAG: permease-like cell division protein FtsX [Patescibacteria group bacterium]|nr:permease-like cell division protein FtsX [Patescibacteria group bacterium]